jgi:hypothetical protein
MSLVQTVQVDSTQLTEAELHPAMETGDLATLELDKAGLRGKINQRCRLVPWHRIAPVMAEEPLEVAAMGEPTGQQVAVAAPAWERPHRQGLVAMVAEAGEADAS